MQTALQNPALRASRRPTRWIPKGADRVADEVAEEGVFVVRRLDFLSFWRVGCGEHQAAMEGKGQRGGEEERHRQHMGRIVVKVQILVSGVGYPVQMAEDAIGKCVSPGAHQHRPEHHQRGIGEDREAEGDRNMVTDAELSGDLDLAKGPRDESAVGADRDYLPETTFRQRGYSETVGYVGRRDVDQPGIPFILERRAPEDQNSAESCKEDRRYPEEADVERPDPEVEQISAYERPSADAIFPLEAEHCHNFCLRIRGLGRSGSKP